MDTKIDDLGYEDSDLTSSEREDRIRNNHLQFHDKLTSLTGPKNFNPDPEDYIKIPGVNTPTGLVLHKAFEQQNRESLLNKSHAKSIKIYFRNFILLEIQSTMDI